MELDSEKVKPGATVFAHRGRPRPFPVRGVSGEPPRTHQAHQGKGTSLGHWLAGLCFFFFFFFRMGIESIQWVMEGNGGKGEGEEERGAQIEGER